MFCPQCGEKNPDDAKFCSKCGAALTAKAEKAPSRRAAPAATGETRTSGMAIAALVMGILSFVVFGPLAVLAIIFGVIGLNQTGKDPTLKGKGMAVAGLVMGIIGVAGWVIAVAVWSSFFWWF
jgi:uncharacterized membrane protein YvbJ